MKERQSWDHYFMDMCRFIAGRSKDSSTKVGSVIVGPDREVRSTGYNGFARGINDSIKYRNERPVKYLWTAHAEENAITNAARMGTALKGCTLYVAVMKPGIALPPCSTCARLIIQSGIQRVVYEQSDDIPERWKENMETSIEMMKEAKLELSYIKTKIERDVEV